MSEFKPVTLVSKSGVEREVLTAGEMNSLIYGDGWKPKGRETTATAVAKATGTEAPATDKK